MTDPKVKDRTGEKGKEPQPKEPRPSKGAGRKHNVQQRPEDQRSQPDPKREKQ